MPSVMMMADTIIKGGKINVIQTDESLIIEANSSSPLNTNKLNNIANILKGNDVEDNISSYAPIYYLISYLAGSGVVMNIDGNKLIIGD